MTQSTSLRLVQAPSKPGSETCQNAWRVLDYTHTTTQGFLTLFASQQARKRQGSPSSGEHDLLRAMLVFASAGMDSMVKHLVQDALPTVVKNDRGAHENLREFVEDKLESRERPNYGLLARALVSPNPVEVMIALLVDDLKSNSLQSAEQLLRVGSFFDVKSDDITGDIPRLKEIFRIRNEIVHEMDIDFSRPNRNRRSRTRDRMIAATNYLLEVAAAFLRAVDTKSS